MKRQWSIILAIIFALIVAVFAVINVEPVEVDYLFGTAEWPLVLIILGSVLMGGFIVAATGVVRILTIQRKLRVTEKENSKLKNELDAMKEQQEQLPKTQADDDVQQVDESTQPS